jgi:hypothetical protein
LHIFIGRGNDCRRLGECLYDVRHISPVSLNGALVQRARACAVPAQIDGDCLAARSKMRHQSVPVAVSAAKSVGEDDRRTALAGNDMADKRDGQALGGLSRRQPSSIRAHKASSASWRPAALQSLPVLARASQTALTGFWHH